MPRVPIVTLVDVVKHSSWIVFNGVWEVGLDQMSCTFRGQGLEPETESIIKLVCDRDGKLYHEWVNDGRHHNTYKHDEIKSIILQNL